MIVNLLVQKYKSIHEKLINYTIYQFNCTKIRICVHKMAFYLSKVLANIRLNDNFAA